ncbi:MAG: hypothetical protein RBG1_1C00001G0816 [candidate division Zixibacteria bacterium RBG-1]|nr:MAG: hypothetical protein RBG1_1C00001G0816 [candidate division Zixibacteria bacterium RBG-1]OGC83503.1 MAG: hypothetical protein A2V73_03880 [candidate division Zixibacteria bacterium RBG_19FT_COMBO_42_43]
MFNKYLTILFIVVAIFWIPAVVWGVRIIGGQLKDIVVMKNGTGPGEIKGYTVGAFLCQPDALDIDIRGNIYLHDNGNSRIQIFSPSGQYLKEIQLDKLLKDRATFSHVEEDITVDNFGNVYLVDSAKGKGKKKGSYSRLVRFSSQGNVSVIAELLPIMDYGSSQGISTDYFGNLYLFAWLGPSELAGRIEGGRISVFDPGGKLEGRFEVFGRGFPPESQIVQKADSLGRVIFMRNGYLCLSEVPFIKYGTAKDSVKIPEELLSYEFRLIGFDLEFNIYFLEEHRGFVRGKFWDIHVSSIHRFNLYKDDEGAKKLFKTGEVILDFNDLSREEFLNLATEFVKQFVVAGNGEVYFLHGTIHKLTLSKIIFEEDKNEK